MKSKIQLGKLIRVTAGGRHGWYESSLGFPVKKPLQGEYIEAGTMTMGEDTGPGVVLQHDTFEPPIVKRESLWGRFVMWWKNLLK